MTIDFRMTSSTLFSDVVLPAATWYEKHDLSTTDMHPFVHSFNPAIAPPWQTKTDWDAWKAIAKRSPSWPSTTSAPASDVVAKPLWHDTPEAMATEHGSSDWRTGECEPVPGKTMPVLAVAERDYTAIYDKMTSIGPLMEKVGMLTKGVAYDVKREIDILRNRNGVARGGAGDGQPARDRHPDGRCDPAPVGRRPTATWPPRASSSWRSAPAPSCTTWRPSTRASRSPSPTPRSRRCR
jgi:nitrate reductase alpha subunit